MAAANPSLRKRPQGATPPPPPLAYPSKSAPSSPAPLSPKLLILIVGTVLALLQTAFLLSRSQSSRAPVERQKSYSASAGVLSGASVASHGPEAETLWLAVLGHVFDVSAGRANYGPDGGYSGFVGRDGSRAFATGQFDDAGLVPGLDGLSEQQVVDVWGWKEFYEGEAKYPFVGRVEGEYFDAEGQKTGVWERIETVVRERKVSDGRVEREEKAYPLCDAERIGKEGRVWCKEGLPRLLTYVTARGVESKRCACVTERKWREPEGIEIEAKGRMELYIGCGEEESSCET